MRRRFLHEFAGIAALVASSLVARGAFATTTGSNVPNTLRDLAGSDAARSVLVRVDEALNALTYTTYSDVNEWDAAAGRYKVVCSQYVLHILDDAAPASLDAVREYADRTRPMSTDYVSFLRTLEYGETADGWTRIRRVKDLRPGDVVAWAYSPSPSPTGAIGHVLFVVSVPERQYEFTDMTVYKVRVSDSTSTAHSADSRCSTCTGVGAGEMLFRTDPSTGKPIAFSWSTGGFFRSDAIFALGRPVE